MGTIPVGRLFLKSGKRHGKRALAWVSSTLLGVNSLSFVVSGLDTLQERRERFDVSRHTVQLRSILPAHHGLKIAHVSDIHLGPGTPDGRVRQAIATINAESPDLVLISGDLLTMRATPLSRLQVLAGLEPPTFVTLGNHDHWIGALAIRRAVEDMGYVVLQNEVAMLPIRGAPLAIVGIDDGYTHHADVDRAFEAVPADVTRIVMAHLPPTAQELPEGQDLLCLSGHTHGGHIVVPRVTEWLAKQIGQTYLTGFHDVRGNRLFVNRGLGFGRGGVPRFHAEPEVALFSLHSVQVETGAGSSSAETEE